MAGRLQSTKRIKEQGVLLYMIQRVLLTSYLLVLLFGGGLVFTTVSAQQAPTIKYQITEELPAHSLIGNLATDAGLSVRYSPDTLNQLRYNFLVQGGDDVSYLHIQENTGIIQTAQQIDRDVICPEQPKCYIILDVAISPREYFQMITIKVEIMDLNDNAPTFPQKELTHHISESTSPGTSIGIPSAEDPDSNQFGIQQYQLLPESQSAFDLKVTHILDGSTDLQLVLLNKLDREAVDTYQLEIVALDGGNPPQSGSIIVNVKVDDTNDNHPMFDYESYEIDVFEDTDAGTTIANVIAHDADSGRNGEITYSFTKRTQSGYGKTFGIEPTSGAIYLKHALDYEKSAIYHLVVVAADSGPDSHMAHATVIVRVLDVNDSPPQITINTLTPSGEAQICEASHIETFVAHVSAIDLDSGANGAVTCTLDSEKFKLEKMYKSQYKIVTAAEFDREKEDSYTIELECVDGGEMPLRTTEKLRVQVLDTNDHVPKFSTDTYTAAVDENNFITAFVVAVSASDLDIGPNGLVRFRIDNEEHRKLFQLEEHTGVIRAGTEFDHETISSVVFEVIAYDQGIPSLSSTATVSVAVRDINDSPPVFSQNAYSFGIHENKQPGTEVGTVGASDADSPPYNKVEYFLDADDLDAIESFTIDHLSGQITTKRTLDREISSIYNLRVKAINDDYTPLSSTVSVTVYVADQNDNSPVMDFPVPYNNTVTISSFVPVGYDIIRIRAHDEDIGVNSEIVYTITDDYELFEVNSITGAIQTTGLLGDIVERQFNMTVRASDNGKPSRFASNLLFIRVTNTIPYQTATEQKSESPLFTSNSTIVIGVACGSLIVIIVLLCAIIIIKCNDRRQPKPSGSYNCRVEAQKMLSKDQKASLQDETSPQHRLIAKENVYGPSNQHSPSYSDMQKPIGHTGTLGRGGGHNTGTLGHAGTLGHTGTLGHGGTMSPQSRGKGNKPNGTLPRQGSFTQENPSATNSLRSNKGTLNRPLHEKEMEVHKVLEYLRRQDDDGDASTADSGRGTTAGDEPDFNNLYNGSYTSFSSNLNDREALKGPQTIAIETKKNGGTNGNNSGFMSPSAPKLSTFAPPSTPGTGDESAPKYSPVPTTRTPHPARNRIIKVDDPCGCHGNSPVIVKGTGGSGVQSQSHHDSGYHGGNSDSDHNLDSPNSVNQQQQGTVLSGRSAGGTKGPGVRIPEEVETPPPPSVTVSKYPQQHHQSELMRKLQDTSLKDSVV